MNVYYEYKIKCRRIANPAERINNAPIISDFADGIKFRGYGKDELLLLSGKKFKILSKELDNGIYKISVVQQ